MVASGQRAGRMAAELGRAAAGSAPAALSPHAQLSAFRLGSAALPIGAFAYSQGLEQAVASGAVHDAPSAERWMRGLLTSSVLTLDVPLLRLMQIAWQADDRAEVQRLGNLLFAMRGSHELREEERQLGAALGRLLAKLGIEAAAPFVHEPRATLVALFALAAVSWEIPEESAALSYCFAWAEAQVGAATRLIPLGQSQAQRVLSSLIAEVAAGVPFALGVDEPGLAATTPGQALLSMAHETQYSRLFRS